MTFFWHRKHQNGIKHTRIAYVRASNHCRMANWQRIPHSRRIYPINIYGEKNPSKANAATAGVCIWEREKKRTHTHTQWLWFRSLPPELKSRLFKLMPRMVVMTPAVGCVVCALCIHLLFFYFSVPFQFLSVYVIFAVVVVVAWAWLLRAATAAAAASPFAYLTHMQRKRCIFIWCRVE